MQKRLNFLSKGLMKNLTLLYLLKERDEILPFINAIGTFCLAADVMRFGHISVSVITRSPGFIALINLLVIHERSSGE